MRECSQRLDVSLKTGKVYSEVDHRNHLPSPETCLVAAIKNYYNLAMKKKPDSNIANVKTQLITLAQNLNIVQFLPNEAHISRAFRKNKNRCEVKVKEEETADLLDLEQVSSRGVLFSNGDYGETKFLQYDSKKDNEYSELTTRCLIYYDSQILEHTAYFDSYACDLSFTAVPKQFKKVKETSIKILKFIFFSSGQFSLNSPTVPIFLLLTFFWKNLLYPNTFVLSTTFLFNQFLKLFFATLMKINEVRLSLNSDHISVF